MMLWVVFILDFVFCCRQKLQEEMNQAEQVALCLDAQISRDTEAVQGLAHLAHR